MDNPIISPQPIPHKPIINITLLITWPTGGGARLTTIRGDGHLDQVIIDGIARAPRTHDVELAYFWLMANHYEPTGSHWTQPPAFYRQRKETFIHASTKPKPRPDPLAAYWKD